MKIFIKILPGSGGITKAYFIFTFRNLIIFKLPQPKKIENVGKRKYKTEN